MRRAVCPGSFDPPTNGHLDIIGRAASLFDELVVAVLINKTKKSLFTVEERIAMLREVVAPYPNVVVDSFDGLLVDYCRVHEPRQLQLPALPAPPAVGQSQPFRLNAQ